MNKEIVRTADRIVTIVVDEQNDFITGSLAVTDGGEVISPTNDLIDYTRTHDGTVIFTGDQHPEQTPHFDAWPVHCVENTWGAAFHEDLNVQPTDIIIRKGTGQTDGYSGFDGEALDGTTIKDILRPRHDLERVLGVVVGLATDYCVKATAKDAANFAKEINTSGKGRIDILLATNAIRAVNLQPDDGKNALQEMKEAGVLFVTTADILG